MDEGNDAADIDTPGHTPSALNDPVSPSISIELLSEPRQLDEVSVLFDQIWGTTKPIVSIEMLRAIAHAGGYVSGAFEHRDEQHAGRLVGASVGFLGRYNGELCLHSHITGILAGARSTGVGRGIKQHQREWCLGYGIDWMTWTFDPLSRRNAWFNIEILGAEIAEYLVDFYGPMQDAVNRGGDSDRLLAAWNLSGRRRLDPPANFAEAIVEVPENIVSVRRTDPAEADRWRTRVRDELCDKINSGGIVTGFDRDVGYVVQYPA